MEKPMGERIASVETELKTLIQAVSKMDGKFDAFLLVAVTHPQLHEKLEEQNGKIASLDEKITAVDKRRWVQNTLSAVLGSVLTGLIGFIFLILSKVIEL